MAQDWRQMMSRVEEHTIQSEVLGAERNYTVYLPAGYAKALGQYDLKTFEVKMRPEAQNLQLAAGMSAIIK